jgi:DNA-directed RNA polymerase subunit beta'
VLTNAISFINLFEARKPRLPGSVNPHDLLRADGLAALWRFIIDEVQKIYRRQGVVINDNHFEIILKQMTGFVKVRRRGDSIFQAGGYYSARGI